MSDEYEDLAPSGQENAACQSCRKRKLKCSREIPTCSQCQRLSCQCIYDHKKQKTGVKSGAIESLNRRIEALEQQLASHTPQPPTEQWNASQNREGCLYHAALLVADSIGRMQTGGGDFPRGGTNLISCTEHLASNKRRSASRLETEPLPKRQMTISYPVSSPMESLFSPSFLEIISKSYFSKIHAWIPCVHQSRFEGRLKDPTESPKLRALVNAMVSSTVKHLSASELGMKPDELSDLETRARTMAVQHAMESLSVENLQALIILTFDQIGNGQLSKSWPIIGSCTRMVEYLQLNVESDEVSNQALFKPLMVLDHPNGWAESEERRRVFWNVFLLDRFCALSTRWSTTLTSSNVCRRLPSDGNIWAKGEKATTPHFGVWDRSIANIDNSIAHIPIQRSDPAQSTPKGNVQVGIDPANVGAFAYRIEATESLFQVCSFFLQQSVNFRSREEVGNWLTRFKELDLRLVHWKTFLPPKWKDSNVSVDGSTVKMDPNLTVAHLTHNTSMILLHQYVAYPPPNLNQMVKLPSSCSAETCELAAIESASIVEKYLKYTPSKVVPGQLGFCVFVAARTLLVHWRVYGDSLASEFDLLLQSLQLMSRGWQGERYASHNPPTDLWHNYYSLLLSMKARVEEDASFLPHILLHQDMYNIPDLILLQGRCEMIRNTNPVEAASAHLVQDPDQLNYFDPQAGHEPSDKRTECIDLAEDNSPSFRYDEAFGDCFDDELAAMTSSLLQKQFLELDRVITLEGTDFTSDKFVQ